MEISGWALTSTPLLASLFSVPPPQPCRKAGSAHVRHAARELTMSGGASEGGGTKVSRLLACSLTPGTGGAHRKWRQAETAPLPVRVGTVCEEGLKKGGELRVAPCCRCDCPGGGTPALSVASCQRVLRALALQAPPCLPLGGEVPARMKVPRDRGRTSTLMASRIGHSTRHPPSAKLGIGTAAQKEETQSMGGRR